MSDITEITLFVLMLITIYYVTNREDRLIKSIENSEQSMLEKIVKQFSTQQIDITSVLAQQHIEYINESAAEIKTLVKSVEKLNSSVENVFTETSKVESAVTKVTDEVSKVTNEVSKVTDSVKLVQNAVIELTKQYKVSHNIYDIK